MPDRSALLRTLLIQSKKAQEERDAKKYGVMTSPRLPRKPGFGTSGKS
jgi:hypothetical protein